MSLALRDKSPILPTTAQTAPALFWRRLIAVTCLAAVWGLGRIYSNFYNETFSLGGVIDYKGGLCPQTDQITPVKHLDLYQQLGSVIESDDYKQRAINWLAGAVRIPTESYDGMDPVGQDPRWDAFAPLHTYLQGAFPIIHANLALTKVNTHGLVYHWQGSSPELKPLLLTAHQDVVPVDPQTVDQWIYPPYSGHFDGTYVWGRGSCDDKSGLISSMSTVETLLEQGFTPARTIVLAFGFDEESSGGQGAAKIGEYLLEQYGEDAFMMLVDEGSGWDESLGQVLAIPGVGEKGYIDVGIEVATPGGHSSVPPAHTSIGILSALLVAIESNPFVPHIGRTQPAYETLKCAAAYAPDMPARLRKDIIRSVHSDKALRRVEDELFVLNPLAKATFGTTQAIDLIEGGVKINALPEKALAIVNHRIATDSSVDAVKQHVTSVLSPVAAKYNLSFSSFNNELVSEEEAGAGRLSITDIWGTSLEPAPVTPTGPNSAPYKLLSGTIKTSLLDSDLFRDTNTSVVIAPGIMTGNTDTRFYWKLTPHIFRYGHHGVKDAYGGVHTVNEAMMIDGIIREIRFFMTLILNSDESGL